MTFATANGPDGAMLDIDAPAEETHMPDTLFRSWSTEAAPRSAFTRYQRMVVAPDGWPAATIAPDLTEAALAADLPGLAALAAGDPSFPCATIAPDLEE